MNSTHTLGDPRLDADHEQLSCLIDALAAATGLGVRQALQALRAHAKEHFDLEDQDLRLMRDGNATCHLDEHAQVLRSLEEVDAIIAEDTTSRESDLLIARLVAELRRWLPEHVQAMDAAVAHFRSRRRLGGAPVMVMPRSTRAIARQAR
jgi:hemerythrin